MIVVVEEVVEESVIRRDPNRTVIPGAVVDAVVEEPFACHPSFAQGYYDRDNRFYLEWDRIAKEQETLDAWLDEWVYGLANHREYVEKYGDALLGRAAARARAVAARSTTGGTRERSRAPTSATRSRS